MNKMLTMLRDKRGNAMLFGLAFAIFILLLSIVVVKGLETRATISYIQATAEQVLDKYTATQGRKADSSFKNGNDIAVTLDEDLYIEKLRDALGIGSDNTGNRNGKVRFILSDISLSYTVSNEIDSTVKLKITIPIYWDGTQVSAVNGTVTARSKYESKE